LATRPKKNPLHHVSAEQDLVLWTKHIAKAIREGTLGRVQWENVAEEIEGMGVREALAVSGLLGRIISTMLGSSTKQVSR
jgi:hypothetical protein